MLRIYFSKNCCFTGNLNLEHLFNVLQFSASNLFQHTFVPTNLFNKYVDSVFDGTDVSNGTNIDQDRLLNIHIGHAFK